MQPGFVAASPSAAAVATAAVATATATARPSAEAPAPAAVASTASATARPSAEAPAPAAAARPAPAAASPGFVPRVFRLLASLAIAAYGYGLWPLPSSPSPHEPGQPAAASPGPALSTAYADTRSDDQVGGVALGEREVPDAPSIQAPSGLVATADGTVLWERGSQNQVPMASTVKIMTCVVALENADLGMECLVTKGAAETGGTTAWILQGDVIVLSDLLVGLMLPSGNDAAVAIAENVGGDVFSFVDMMNAKAAELGMNNTHYVDPNGLDEEGLYSTVEDYLILTRYAMRNKTFRQIVSQREATIFTKEGRQIDYMSTNRLFWAMDGVIGVKTGTNSVADACLVACINYNGTVFYSVVFGSPTDESRYTDTRALMEWAFRHYRPAELINSTVVCGEVALTSWLDKTVTVRVPYPVAIPVFDLAGPITQEVELSDWQGAISRGQKAGRIIWTQDGEVLATADLVADASVDAPDFWQSVSIRWQRITGGQPEGQDQPQTKVFLPGIFEIPPAF